MDFIFLALLSIRQELDFSSFTGGNLYLILHWTLFHLIPHPGKMAKIHAWCIYPCRLPSFSSDVYLCNEHLCECRSDSVTSKWVGTGSWAEPGAKLHKLLWRKSLTVNMRMIFRYSLPSCPQGAPLCGCYSFSLICPFTLCRCCCWVGKTQLVQSKPLGAGSWLCAPSGSALSQLLLQRAKQILNTPVLGLKDYPDCRGDVTTG